MLTVDLSYSLDTLCLLGRRTLDMDLSSTFSIAIDHMNFIIRKIIFSIKKMIETGVVANIWNKYLDSQQQNDCVGNSLEALGFGNVVGIFMVLFSALSLSLIIFIIEMLLK